MKRTDWNRCRIKKACTQQSTQKKEKDHHQNGERKGRNAVRKNSSAVSENSFGVSFLQNNVWKKVVRIKEFCIFVQSF